MTADANPFDRLLAAVPRLRAFAISLARDVTFADDLVQETILKAWSNMDKFDPGTNLDAWLFVILRNTFYSARRKTRREIRDIDGTHAGRLFVPPTYDARLAFQDFLRAFDQLSPEHREVLILVGASGFNTKEAASMMGVATGTVKSRTSRARNRLVELLGLKEGENIFSDSNLGIRDVSHRQPVVPR